MIEIKKLDWDSNFFDLKIGKISLTDINKNDFDAFLSLKKKENYQLIYVFSDSKIDFLAAQLVDSKVTFQFEIENDLASKTSENIKILSKNHELNQNLLDLALQSGEYSRFKIDENFPKNSFEKLYQLWIKNSLNHDIADAVMAFENQNQTDGLVTLKHDADTTHIGLIAVNSEARGQKIGSQLLDAVKKIASKKQKKYINVATQLENELACRFYEKNQFYIKKIEYIYHIWL